MVIPPTISATWKSSASRHAKNGAKFRRLYAGDTGGYASHSEADAGLCSMLAFYTGPDRARLDELFREAG